MPQFIFVVEVPSPGHSSEEPDATSRWFQFEKRANAIALPKGCPKKPARNVWPLISEGVDTILAGLIAAAKENRFSHSTFCISGEITSMSKPIKKPTQ